MKVLKGRFLLVMAIILVLSGGTAAMAHGGGSAPSTSSLNGNNQSSDMKGMDMNGKDKNMDMSDSKKGDDMQGMKMGGEEPVKETPPSVKVLGTYGAVNLIFILIGIWNKWFRRKDGLNGDSK